MKRSYIQSKWYSVALLCTVMLVGCVQEQLTESGESLDDRIVNATFTLSPDFVEEIEVRSIDGVDEKVIKDLWVIQLKADGTGQLHNPQYIETGFTSSASDYKVTIPLLRQASKIYFIANTHNASAYTGKTTSTDVEAVTMVVTGEANLASANGIPMSGMWTGTPDLLGIAGRVSLSRAIAKVNFNLNASLPVGEVFTLKSITVKQVPDKLNYYRDATKLDVYPYPATPTIINDYSTTAYNEILNTTSKSLWWYLPENARGTGTATIQTDKGLKLPTGQAAYCTYLEVKGMYEAAGGTYETTYKIYLGTNNYNDYNVKRNTVYNINTTIKGIDAADTRINSTDISIIVGPFGGWDETKKEYTKLLEVQCVETAKDPALKWSKDQTFIGATNIHYGPTNIIILSGLSSDLSNYPAVKYCADLGNGWYLPSQNQLMAVWITNNCIPKTFKFGSANYWSASEYQGGTSWFVNFYNGVTNAVDKADNLVRCVRDITPLTNTLTSIVVTDASNRAIIDCRKFPAEAITTEKKAQVTDGLLDKLGTNDLTNIGSAENNKKVSSYFEISKTDLSGTKSWLTAVQDCSTYDSGDGVRNWRLPTQRELMLIWTMHETLKFKITDFKAFSNVNNYWSATEYTTGESWTIVPTNGNTVYISKGLKNQVRCVRDLTPPAN